MGGWRRVRVDARRRPVKAGPAGRVEQVALSPTAVGDAGQEERWQMERGGAEGRQRHMAQRSMVTRRCCVRWLRLTRHTFPLSWIGGQCKAGRQQAGTREYVRRRMGEIGPKDVSRLNAAAHRGKRNRPSAGELHSRHLRDSNSRVQSTRPESNSKVAR